MGKTDYSCIDMSMKDLTVGFLIGLASGFAVIMIYYGNIAAALAVGFTGGCISVKMYRNYIIKKRKQELLLQFKALLESLTSSYSAGRNTLAAFKDSYSDLKTIYGEDADIIKELKILLDGMNNGMTAEKMLTDFAVRSGLEDISDFADFFEVCSRRGANIGKVMVNARNIIGTKIDMEQEIDNILAPGKQEIKILAALPFLIVPFVNGHSVTPGVNTVVTFTAKSVALVLFIAAIWLGKKITDIKV